MAPSQQSLLLSFHGWVFLFFFLGSFPFSFPGFCDPALTYDGAVALAENVMPALVQAFSGKTGIPFASLKSSGSNEGFQQAMAGTIDVGGVARSLTREEKRQKPYYQIIGYDGIALFIHPGNPVSNLSKEQVKGIFTGTILSWSELGGPDLPIVPVMAARSRRPGITRNFQWLVLDGRPCEGIRETSGALDHLHHVATTPGAITFDSASFSLPTLKTLTIDAIQPIGRHLSSGAYPFSLPLLLVHKTVPTGAIKDFFAFVLSEEGQAIVGKTCAPAFPHP
jgi:phosphate transport system substrate-binding protein